MCLEYKFPRYYYHKAFLPSMLKVYSKDKQMRSISVFLFFFLYLQLPHREKLAIYKAKWSIFLVQQLTKIGLCVGSPSIIYSSESQNCKNFEFTQYTKDFPTHCGLRWAFPARCTGSLSLTAFRGWHLSHFLSQLQKTTPLWCRLLLQLPPHPSYLP